MAGGLLTPCQGGGLYWEGLRAVGRLGLELYVGTLLIKVGPEKKKKKPIPFVNTNRFGLGPVEYFKRCSPEVIYCPPSRTGWGILVV